MKKKSKKEFYFVCIAFLLIGLFCLEIAFYPDVVKNLGDTLLYSPTGVLTQRGETISSNNLQVIVRNQIVTPAQGLELSVANASYGTQLPLAVKVNGKYLPTVYQTGFFYQGIDPTCQTGSCGSVNFPFPENPNVIVSKSDLDSIGTSNGKIVVNLETKTAQYYWCMYFNYADYLETGLTPKQFITANPFVPSSGRGCLAISSIPYPQCNGSLINHEYSTPSPSYGCDFPRAFGVVFTPQEIGWENLPNQSVLNFESWFDSSNCVLSEGTMVVAETFSAGRTIKPTDLRFPAKAFCSTLPILVTESDKIVAQKLEEYDIFQKSYLTIPAGQTWTLFYIADLSPDVAVICPEGSAYEVDKQQCTNYPPFVYSCSGTGVFDPEQQLCVSQSITICDDGGTYNTELGMCVKYIQTQIEPIETCVQTDVEGACIKYEYPEVVVVCPQGSTVYTEGTNIKKCVYSPDSNNYVYQPNPDLDEIELPIADTSNNLGFNFNTFLFSVLGSIFIISGFALLFFYRR